MVKVKDIWNSEYKAKDERQRSMDFYGAAGVLKLKLILSCFLLPCIWEVCWAHVKFLLLFLRLVLIGWKYIVETPQSWATVRNDHMVFWQPMLTCLIYEL